MSNKRRLTKKPGKKLVVTQPQQPSLRQVRAHSVEVFSKEDFKRQNATRWWRVLNYISICFSILVIYLGFIATEYLLFSVIYQVVSDERTTYPFIASVVDYLKIAGAVMFLLCGLAHSVRATYEQLQMDIRLSREDD